jgi:hypothetical protein
MIDPASASEETATARTKLNELLKKNGLTRHPKIKAELIPALAGLEDSPWGEWTALDGTATPHADARSAACHALRHQIEDALAAGTTPGNEIRERIFPSAIRGGMGLLLRTKRHTATGKQIQVLVAAVNRHMPATPSRCCRRRRGRTRSIFPGMYRQVGIYA